MELPEVVPLKFTIDDNFLKSQPVNNEKQLRDAPERYISLISNSGDLLFESVMSGLPQNFIRSDAAYIVKDCTCMPFQRNRTDRPQ
ncbi:hypothetical protein TVAG_267270 [Trichomonas vaginalis G3]|uniref:Uncharacterized protein n=1 Tax=Trichomonas vaginalis (strain ATCC PRA-98 / G3) TaxID=412133 RepID=A2F565_TRIV3|nr:hypothetical protein TVAGG3_0496020 [Trichomonas vaginalis G3]EAX99958.1 hypothetical protein TVAG_267270 [Trichomonas vaginalis G3]KAI5516723.1 hypothetical protein TVAGG3_0496020 [Trichomonas vaginalis G3]|eukprot:XP_001312888.1 hypothetical protein [Trichomonas vaginalis G3]